MNDLYRRIPEFAGYAESIVGKDSWNKLGDNTKAALTSVMYNYGPGNFKKNTKLVKAIQTGNTDVIANTVSGLSSNKARRNREAKLILQDSNVPTNNNKALQQSLNAKPYSNKYSQQTVQPVDRDTFTKMPAEQQVLYYNAYRTAHPDGLFWDTANKEDAQRNALGEQLDSGKFSEAGYINFMEKTMKDNNSKAKASNTLGKEAEKQYLEIHPTYSRKKEQLTTDINQLQAKLSNQNLPKKVQNNLAKVLNTKTTELTNLNNVSADMKDIDSKISTLEGLVNNRNSGMNTADRTSAIKELSRLKGIRGKYQTGPRGSYEFTSPALERLATSEQQRRLAGQNESFSQILTVASIAKAVPAVIKSGIKAIGTSIKNRDFKPITDKAHLLEFYSKRKVNVASKKGIPTGSTIVTPSKAQLIAGLEKELKIASKQQDAGLVTELNRQLKLLK